MHTIHKVTVDVGNRDNKVTENGVVINEGNRPVDIAFARNVVRALIADRSYDLTNIDGVCIATTKLPEYIKFSSRS